MKLDNALTKIEKDFNNLEAKVEAPIKGLFTFAKKHKKLLITLGVGYLVYRWLFAEEDEE